MGKDKPGILVVIYNDIPLWVKKVLLAMAVVIIFLFICGFIRFSIAYNRGEHVRFFGTEFNMAVETKIVTVPVVQYRDTCFNSKPNIELNNNTFSGPNAKGVSVNPVTNYVSPSTTVDKKANKNP